MIFLHAYNAMDFVISFYLCRFYIRATTQYKYPQIIVSSLG